jgi:protein-tyrosine phosphatase
MARVALDDGISDILCTPHWVPGKHDNTRTVVLDRVAQARSRLSAAGMDLRLHPGTELRLDISLPARLTAGELLTVNDGGLYALIELPESSLPDSLDTFFWELEMGGFRPIISHVERNAVLRREPERLFRWVEMGYLTQMTAVSVLEDAVPEVHEFSMTLLEHRLIHIWSATPTAWGCESPNCPRAWRRSGPCGDRAARDLVEGTRPGSSGAKPCIPGPDPLKRKKKTFFSFFRSARP